MTQRRSTRESNQGRTSWGAFSLFLLLLVGVAAYELWWLPSHPPADAWVVATATTSSGAASGGAAPVSTSTSPAPAAPSAIPGEATTIPPTKTPFQALTLTPAQAPATAQAFQESIAVWFSDPLANQTTGGPENQLIAGIDGAKKTVDMAIYNLTLPNVSDALLRAKKRGVQVRLVMESEAMDKAIPRKLMNAHIPIIGDQKEGLMHNKFTIIDGQEIFMGSMNYTSTSAYTDFNNLVRLRSARLALDYEANFDEMFVDHKFGTDKQPNTPYAQVSIGRIPVEVYFSPDDGVAKHVTAELLKAQKSIDFMAYSFTSNDFAKAIRDRAKAGVKVRGVFDESQVESNTGGEYATFQRNKFDVKLDGIPGLLHHKVFIIDQKVVITGSYNFSSNAENTNDENLVIIRDPKIAKAFLTNFDAVYGSGK